MTKKSFDFAAACKAIDEAKTKQDPVPKLADDKETQVEPSQRAPIKLTSLNWWVLRGGDTGEDDFGPLSPEEEWALEEAQELLKTRLNEQVKLGEMEREDAEKEWEKATGLNLVVLPKYLDIKGPDLLFWSAAMTASWIRWRDPALVLRHVSQSNSDASIWVKNAVFHEPTMTPVNPFRPQKSYPPEEHTLVRFGKPGLDGSTLRSFIGYDGVRYPWSLGSLVSQEMREYLISGTIRAKGKRVDFNDRATKDHRVAEKIEWHHWADARFKIVQDEIMLVCDDLLAFRDVEFVASDILRDFKPKNTVKGRKRWKPLQALQNIKRKEHLKVIEAFIALYGLDYPNIPMKEICKDIETKLKEADKEFFKPRIPGNESVNPSSIERYIYRLLKEDYFDSRFTSSTIELNIGLFDFR